MDYKQELVFQSNKKELKMDRASDFKVIEIQGIEASSYSINTISSEQDGAVVTSVKVLPREITITGDIQKNEQELTNREYLIRFFAPKQDGVMLIKRNDIERKIQYKVSSLDFTTNKMYHYNQFILVLESTEEPYFLDAKNRGNYLTLISPQFTFPLVIHPTKIMGYKMFKPVMPLVNDGDKEVGIEIIATAKRGKVDNLKFILNNDKYIKLNNLTLNQWDVLKINTNPRKKSVTLNGVNIINKIDRKSTFFSLKIGKNILKYECDNGATNVDIDVQFYRKYLGV